MVGIYDLSDILFPFFLSVCIIFDVISCILKLSNLLVLIPLYSSISFIKLGNSLTYRNPEAMHTKKIILILLDIITILLSFLTDSNFVPVLSHYIATDDTRSFLLLYLNFHIFSASIANDSLQKILAAISD